MYPILFPPALLGRSLVLAALWISIHCQAGRGHNGAVALVYPVKAITVDGDISDWPSEIPVHQVDQLVDGQQSESPNDFSAQFRIGWNSEESALYIAVEVTDDVTAGYLAGPPDNRDSCVLFLAEKHSPGFSSVLSLDAQAVASSNSQNRTVVVRDTDTGRVYEWRLVSRVHMQEMHSIGIDIGLCDVDQDGSRTLMTWGSGGTARTNGYSLGDALLLDAMGAIGRAAGKVKWQGQAARETREYPPVAIRSLDAAETWIRVNCEPSGAYSAALPEGEYEATLVDSVDRPIGARTSARFTVKSNRGTAVAPLSVSSSPEPELIGSRGLLFEAHLDPRVVDRLLQGYMDRYAIPGLSIAIIKNGVIIYRRGLGVRSTATGEPVTESTVFEAASLTKPMFAFAVNRLADSGVLDLDKPLYQYLPYADIAHDDRYRQVTARMVLCHMSGLPNWRNGRLELLFEPGTRFSYSGEAFKYLGEVVSHVAHKNLVDVFQEQVFTPTGIEHAYLTWTAENNPARVATGHKGHSPLPKRLWSEPWTAASLHIDADNYAKFLTAILLRKGMSPSAYDEMLRRRSDGEGQNSNAYALGIVVESTPFGLKYSHGGNNDGFTSEFAVYDEIQSGYVFLVNNGQAAALNEAIKALLITGKQSGLSR